MLDIHPPHHAASSWRDFFIHIATIVLGLVIAIGLEQTVEVLHDHHVRHQLLEDVHAELQSNQYKNRMTQNSLAYFRIYLVGLSHVLRERCAGRSASIDAAMEQHRRLNPLYGSSMAAWQSAKESGHAVLLPSEQIRLYDRLAVQLEYRRDAITAFEHATGAMQAFEERFRDSPAILMFGARSGTPDLASMSSAELTEYSTLVAAAIQSVDRLAARTAMVDAEDMALLRGVDNEDDLVNAALKDINTRTLVQNPSSPAK